MGIMDRVKTTAGKAAEKAQQGVSQGKEKLSEVQEKRKLDGVLHDLGAAVYLDRAGRGSPAITADIERLLAEVRDLEASGAMVVAPDPAIATESAPPPAPEPTPEGSYKLDDV